MPGDAVGAAGVPVNVGEAMLAFKAEIASAYAVVATCVVFVPGAAVGAVGVPVSAGDANGARDVSVG